MRRITFGGETVRQRTVGDATVAETVYAPGLRVEPHEHARPYLAFVLEGACREAGRDRAVDYAPLSLVVKTPGERHWNVAGPSGTRYLLVEVDAARPVRGVFDEYLSVHGGVLAAIAVRLHDELWAGDAAAALAIEALVEELLAEVGESRRMDRPDVAPAWLRRVCELIHDRYDTALTLAALAAEARVHPTHLARSFRRALGVTPGSYLRRVRLARATALLAGSAPSPRDGAPAGTR